MSWSANNGSPLRTGFPGTCAGARLGEMRYFVDRIELGPAAGISQSAMPNAMINVANRAGTAGKG
jgi:hypothetical protein